MVKWSYLCQVFLGFLFLWDISNRHWSVSLEEPGAWLTKIKSSVEKWWKQPFNHCPFSYSLGGAYFTNICWRSSWYRFQMIFILWILCSRSKVRIVMEMPILYMTISNLPDPVVAKTEYEVLCQVRSLFWLLRLGWHSLRYLDMPHNVIDLTHFLLGCWCCPTPNHQLGHRWDPYQRHVPRQVVQPGQHDHFSPQVHPWDSGPGKDPHLWRKTRNLRIARFSCKCV